MPPFQGGAGGACSGDRSAAAGVAPPPPPHEARRYLDPLGASQTDGPARDRDHRMTRLSERVLVYCSLAQLVIE